MSYAEHVVAVISEDTDRVALVRRSFDQIASQLCVVHVADANGAMRLPQCAEDALLEERAVPHLIVLDAWPSERSLKALQNIRDADALADARIIVLCRPHAAADIALAYNLGANSCLTVSADPDEFVEMMKEAGRYWLLLNCWPTW
jgi:DNA-binding NarL/FixJ family response regulator